MTVRFKCQSEYQKSYRAPRSRSVSPQRCMPLAGLRSDQMGLTREPRLQRRRKLGPVGPARSCSSLLCPPDVQNSVAEPAARAHTASRSRSADVKSSSNPKPATPPETPAGPRPAADLRPPAPPEPGPAGEPAAKGKSVKPRPSQPDSQSQPSQPLTAAPDRQQQEDRVMRWRAGLLSGGQRSEYNRQFGWKKPVASPLLSAEQVLNSGSRSVPHYKKNPVPMETEYRRSFLGQALPTGPRLRKHLELQRVPLFHTHMTNRRREEHQKKLRPEQEAAQREDVASPLKATPPIQVQRGHRNPEGGGATEGDAHQAKELRQQARSYRHRAWGTNFSRDHLSQLLSEHNILWEPTDTTDSHTNTATPRPTSDVHPGADSRSSSHVEALDLASKSSKTSSVVGSGEKRHVSKKTQTNRQTPPGPPDERRTAWGEEEEEKEEGEEEENTDEEEGRLPTPRLRMRPVQRTHHDLTTPATGGAIIVGKLKGADDSSPYKQRSGSSVSTPARPETTVDLPVKPKQAWSDNNPASASLSPEHKPASSPPSKPIRTKQTPPSPVAPPPLVPLPQHYIQGTLRHPDFQHNGELGLRFRDLQCSGGGCGSDEDDRLSVMSWRSAASCSMASSVLERAQKRRENFWGKR